MSRWFFKTEADKKADAERRAQRELDREGKRQAKYYAKKFPDWLAQMGVDHWIPRSDRPTVIEAKLIGSSGRQKIAILEAHYTDNAIYLWVDTRELPYRSVLADLHTDEVLETLSDAAGRQVAWKSQPGKGSWYVIWRDGSVNAIPALFKYSEAAAMVPQNAGPLTFIVGVTENNRLIKADLSQMPHYLVAGSTFTGKSVHINQMLCQIISRSTPADVQFMMIDLKGGNEFAYYADLPNLVRPIVSEPEDVIDALKEYQGEIQRRMALFAKRGGVKTIQGWNTQFPGEKLPYIVLAFDEIAQVLMHPDRKMSKEAALILNAVMSVSRAYGGHAVLCTQRPSSDVIPSWVKTNCNVRVCFAVPSNSDSIVVIDKGLAAGLEPVGRAIYSAGPQLTELQSPFISDEQIARIVRQASTGVVESTEPGKVTLQEVFDLAVDDFGGKLNVDQLFESFRGRIAREELRAMLKRLNGDPIEVHHHTYKFVKAGRGWHGGARLELLDADKTIQPRTTTAYVPPEHKIPQGLLKRVLVRDDPANES